ncbi:MAG TPA: aldehyde dehydrogenase family protein, partial [Thermoanaerobaculia bacterium]
MTEPTISVDLKTDLFINGEFVPSTSGKRFATINPATGEALAEVAEADKEDLERAVAAARAAFESGPWARMKPRERGKILMKASELLAARSEEFGRVETLDNGKPIFEAAKIDMPATADCLSYFGESADKLYGDTYPGRPDAMLLTLREPVGVIGAITPWNFPLLQAMWKIAPALALGNTVVLKPASVTPLTSLLFAELLAQAGLPPGAFNVVPGPGAVIGAAMAEHPGIDKISFTGETATGKAILRAAAETVKRVSMELGGKSPNVVFADADLDAAARGAINAIFYGKGELCSAGSRLLVEESAHDALLEKVVERAKKLVPADPLNPKTRLGSLVSEAQRENVERYVESGKREGAKLLAGG